VASVFACVGVFFGQLVQSDLPIQISAERSVFQWEIQRLLLEGKAQQIPTIQQGNSVLKADTIVYEDQKKIGYAFGNVLFQDAQRGAVLRAGEGTYYTKTKEVVATKQPRLSLKKDGVTAVGEVIRFFPEKSILFFFIRMCGSREKIMFFGVIRRNSISRRASFLCRGMLFWNRIIRL
jgi:lipopolysaccharide export system protein LptA